MMKYFSPILLLPFLISCSGSMTDSATFIDSVTVTGYAADTIRSGEELFTPSLLVDTPHVALAPGRIIDTKAVTPDEVVSYATTLFGTPYKYASTNPKDGFDCSGFITYVFNHFGISVPRSSKDFTNVGKPVPLPLAKRGDLILFTGTDSTIREVGHMGIVLENTDTLKFIHSSSGRANGVTISPLPGYYMSRFVKVIDIFNN